MPVRKEIISPFYGGDAVYIASHPSKHFEWIKLALSQKKNVICESPIALNPKELATFFALAKENRCVLMEGIKTAFSTAYSRLLLLVKSGKIGRVVSVDATCTRLKILSELPEKSRKSMWNSICGWAD